MPLALYLFTGWCFTARLLLSSQPAAWVAECCAWAGLTAILEDHARYPTSGPDAYPRVYRAICGGLLFGMNLAGLLGLLLGVWWQVRMATGVEEAPSEVMVALASGLGPIGVGIFLRALLFQRPTPRPPASV
jgi:hypothetical protein